MTSEGPNELDQCVHATEARQAESQGEHDWQPAVIAAERSGDWMPADELRETALAAVEAGRDVTLSLAGLNHLDASAMQIVLALDVEQKHRGRHLQLANVSPPLRQWFEYAGATGHFFGTEQKSDA